MDEQFSYEGLYRLLEERRAKRPEGSYQMAFYPSCIFSLLWPYFRPAASAAGASALRRSP